MSGLASDCRAGVGSDRDSSSKMPTEASIASRPRPMTSSSGGRAWPVSALRNRPALARPSQAASTARHHPSRTPRTRTPTTATSMRVGNHSSVIGSQLRVPRDVARFSVTMSR